ncbi:MAG: hypothetical protein JRJ03_02750 [Deltaproteobacteria bacterium]|nr:hypothetical protein [Deltaproteobacteria bacterium]
MCKSVLRGFWVPKSLVFLGLVSFAACGYHFRSSGEPLGIKIESLAIPMVESPSSDLGFESEFTRILREEFINNSTVPILSEQDARYILIARIYQVKTEPIAYEQQESFLAGHRSTLSVTSKLRLMVKLDIKLVEQSTGKTIWHERSMTERANYDVVADPLVTTYNRGQALDQIASLLSKKVFLKTLERF